MGANLKEVRERITSINSTQQITKAMKMVSAAKLKKAQEGITQMRPYAKKLQEILGNILSNTEGDQVGSFGVERDVNRMAVIVVTSSRGLCGAFNNNIIKSTIQHLEENHQEHLKHGKVDFLCIGKKGADYLKKRYTDGYFYKDYISLIEKYDYESIKALGEYLMRSFSDGTYDLVEVVYGQFKNAALQIPTIEQYLPVEKLEEEGASETKADYIFEPNQDELLNELVPKILISQLQRYILDTSASEHGARMTAMDQATENANDLIKELKITYNKARQEAITKEISEIVGGAAALEG
ncbi:MAG TPA: ATP synthase F1 subunit gamma [Saprospiraceae bacterium]|nr:ATP synthase F1 subunit gamma [Saprospiraceae bacterium]